MHLMVGHDLRRRISYFSSQHRPADLQRMVDQLRLIRQSDKLVLKESNIIGKSEIRHHSK